MIRMILWHVVYNRNVASGYFGGGGGLDAEPRTLDLHGLHVGEAIPLLRRELNALRHAARLTGQQQQVGLPAIFILKTHRLTSMFCLGRNSASQNTGRHACLLHGYTLFSKVRPLNLQPSVHVHSSFRLELFA